MCQQNLREIGEWLQLNGEAIYRTVASPFPYLPYGRATRKNQTIYLHVFKWPANKKLNIPLSNKITKAYLLADKSTSFKITPTANGNQISLPAFAPDKVASVIAIEFVGEPKVLEVPTHKKLVQASSTDVATSLQALTDGDPTTKWRATKGEKTATLEVDLGKAYIIESLALIEPWHPWSKMQQTHELQYLDGDVWRTAVKSTTSGTGSTEQFKKVKAQKFKLILQNEKEAPGLGEFILYQSE